MYGAQNEPRQRRTGLEAERARSSFSGKIPTRVKHAQAIEQVLLAQLGESRFQLAATLGGNKLLGFHAGRDARSSMPGTLFRLFVVLLGYRLAVLEHLLCGRAEPLFDGKIDEPVSQKEEQKRRKQREDHGNSHHPGLELAANAAALTLEVQLDEIASQNCGQNQKGEDNQDRDRPEKEGAANKLGASDRGLMQEDLAEYERQAQKGNGGENISPCPRLVFPRGRTQTGRVLHRSVTRTAGL